jgi:hypothetical protein
MWGHTHKKKRGSKNLVNHGYLVLLKGRKIINRSKSKIEKIETAKIKEIETSEIEKYL